ncbi:MAG: C4-dicarboxylate ABC transporter, partial [Betaproteobacteria bacterium]|nr:C4-dicarboxylate ABC transporter [Betaproteobacteria bacterium]
MNKHRFLRQASLSALCTLALSGLCSIALAQDKVQQVRVSTWVPAQHALNPAVQAWADSLKKASG